MRSSIILAVAAAFAPVFAGQSSVVPIQQIGDGQIQNPATGPAPPPTSYPAPPVTTTVVSTAPPSKPAVPSSAAPPPPPAPPVVKPSGGGIPPSYGNVTSTAKVSNTVTATVVKSSKPAGPSTASSAPAPSGSKPAVQSGSANALAGSTAGLGFAAFLAVLLG